MIYSRLPLAISLCISCASAFAAPSIQSASYDHTKGVLTVSGSGFGTMPQIALYDHFESGTASDGAVIPVTSRLLGSWTSANQYYKPEFSSNARSGKFSFRAYSHKLNKPLTLTKKFPASQEIFLSYWVKLDGDFFPGDLVTAPRQFSGDSSWKLTWLMDTDTSTVNPNLCLPTHTGYGKFSLAGNSHSVGSIDNNWWNWDEWMRLSVWIKPNEADPTQPGTITFQAISKGKKFYQKTESKPVFTSTAPKKQYQQLNVPGWVRSLQDPNTEMLYDDVYLSYGKGSVARVEIGDAPTYTASTMLEIVSPQKWEDLQYVGKVVSELDSAKQYYVYFTDADGKVNSTGIKLSMKAPPAPITNFKVVY